MNKRGILLLFLTAASLLLSLESARERFAAQAAHKELSGALENVVGRVREADRNIKQAAVLTDVMGLAKARAWALLAEADPSCLEDQKRLKNVCRLLDTDEVCVTDETGLLTVSEPKENCGFDLSSTPQSAAFMPAITNKAFELVQAPLPRGLNRDLFQYAGVARRDKPGIAQVGIGRKHIERLRSLVSTEPIARTSRVRRGGYVKIEKTDVKGDVGNRRLLTDSRKVGDWHITVAEPAPVGVLSGLPAFATFCGAAILLAFLLLRTIIPDIRRTSAVQLRTCAFACLGVLALFFAFESFRATAEAQTVRKQLLLSLENVTSRVRSALENEKTFSELVKESNLAKKRAYELLVKTDPTILSDTNRLDYARRTFTEEDPNEIRALAGLDDACRTVRSPDGSFTEVTSFTRTDADYPKGYFTETCEGRPYLCLAAKCADRLVTVGVPTPERFLTRTGVRTALLILAALLFVCTLGSLAPEAVSAAVSCAMTTFQFFWGLRSSETKGLAKHPRQPFWHRLTNPIVLACLIGYLCCLFSVMALRSREAETSAQEMLRTSTEGMVKEVSRSVDNMILAIARAVARHYRSPDALSQKDAEDLMHRYDVDEISIADAKGILNVTTCGSVGFDMGAYESTRPFNDLLHGKKDTLVQPFRVSAADVNVCRKFGAAAFPDAPGYVEVGIDRVRLLNSLRYLFADNIRGKAIGKRGFLIWVVDETGEIVANGAPDARSDDTLASIGFNAATAPEAGVPFKADFYGLECLVVWRPYANMRLYSVLPRDEISCVGQMFVPSILITIAFSCFLLLALRLADLVA